MAEVSTRDDPYRGFNFKIEIDNTTLAGFRECSGLSFTTDPVEYREGTEKTLHPRKLTGMRKFANISLKRGITQNAALWNWYKDVLNGNPRIRRDGSIVLLDEERKEVMRWRFVEGWICKWEGPMFNATSNDVAIETIEICVERVELV